MAEKFTPHGVSGVRFAPAYHRPHLRYFAPVDGAEGGDGEAETVTKAKYDELLAESRKWESRAKDNKKLADDNAGAAQRLADLENANKTEADKAADRIAALEKQVADQSRIALVARIQAKHGITDEDADLFLTGADADALEKQAARLAARDGEQKKKQSGVSRNEGDAKNKGKSDEEWRESVRGLFGATD